MWFHGEWPLKIQIRIRSKLENKLSKPCPHQVVPDVKNKNSGTSSKVKILQNRSAAFPWSAIASWWRSLALWKILWESVKVFLSFLRIGSSLICKLKKKKNDIIFEVFD